MRFRLNARRSWRLSADKPLTGQLQLRYPDYCSHRPHRPEARPMDIVIQILIGLLTIFIGFLLGNAWQISRRRVVYWQARRFWRPFVSGDVKIVIGRFREFD